MGRVGMMGQLQKVTRVESPGCLAGSKPGKTSKVGPQPQGDLSSSSISMVIQFSPLTFHVAGHIV